MINGLSKYSTSGAKSAIAYFLAQSYKGVIRACVPQLLKGDPARTLKQCMTSNFKHKYTSGVLSFSATETKTIDQNPFTLISLLKEFEDFAFAGTPNDCRDYLAVQHRHTGRLEIHYLIPRVHQGSLKYFNPFPPGFRASNDLFVDYVCDKYNLENPRHISRRRGLGINPFEIDAKFKINLHNEVMGKIHDGSISSSSDMKVYFIAKGFRITRHGANYISLKIDNNKPFRMKGSIYGKLFTSHGLAQQLAEEEVASEIGQPTLKQRYGSAVEKRSEYTQRRHGTISSHDATSTKGAGINMGDIEKYSTQLKQATTILRSVLLDHFDSRAGDIDWNSFVNNEICLTGNLAEDFSALGIWERNTFYMAIKAIVDALKLIFGSDKASIHKNNRLNDIFKQVIIETIISCIPIDSVDVNSESHDIQPIITRKRGLKYDQYDHAAQSQNDLR